MGGGASRKAEEWFALDYLVIKKGNTFKKNMALIDGFAALLEDACKESRAFVNRTMGCV